MDPSPLHFQPLCPLAYLLDDILSTYLALRELSSSNRPLMELETLSVYAEDCLDYLKKQHTPLCRHVRLLDHVLGHDAADQAPSRRGASEACDDNCYSQVEDMLLLLS